MFNGFFKGTHIFEELCNCPWYRFKPADRKILILMLMKTRKQITITVGSYGNLSMSYFTQVKFYITYSIIYHKPKKIALQLNFFFLDYQNIWFTFVFSACFKFVKKVILNYKYFIS